MLFVLILIAFTALHPCWATESSLKALNQKAQQEASAYKEALTSLQTQAQKAVRSKTTRPRKTKPKKIVGGRCYGLGQPLGSCLRKTSTFPPKESPLLTDKAPLIFVSASMPLPSLKTLAYQAQKYQAKLVIRGMVKGSLQETAELVKVIGYPLDIDPKLFQAYGIQKVPVFLIYDPHTLQNKSDEGQWHTVQGNVDLLFALEKAKEHSLQEQRVSS